VPLPDPNDLPTVPPLAQPASKLVNNNDATIKLPFDVFMMCSPFIENSYRLFLLVYSAKNMPTGKLLNKWEIHISIYY